MGARPYLFEEIEQQITFPIEQALYGLPNLEGATLSISQFGLSQAVVVFADGTDVYFARQLLSERLSTVSLPEGLANVARLGPVATGLGEVPHYVLTYRGIDFTKIPEADKIRMLTDLRLLHDWVVRPALRTVPGVAEINSWGGFEKQYQVRIDPLKRVTGTRPRRLRRCSTPWAKNHRNVGGVQPAPGRSGHSRLTGVGRTNNDQRSDRTDHRDRKRDGVPISHSRCGEGAGRPGNLSRRHHRRRQWRSRSWLWFHAWARTARS